MIPNELQHSIEKFDIQRQRDAAHFQILENLQQAFVKDFPIATIKDLNLADNIEIQARKDYIAFKKNSNIADITIQRKGLKMWINLKKGNLDDPKKITRDVSETGHWGNGDYELLITDTNNLEYIMSLVKQAI